MTVEEALDNLRAAHEAREASMKRAFEDIDRQFDFIVKLRERQYQEAFEHERARQASGRGTL